MCDQDHFDEDRKEYEALGRVTRRQFGVILGAGIALMLPAGSECGRRHRIGREHHPTAPDCYFVHPACRAHEYQPVSLRG